MRALLLFNPNATTTDDRVRDVIASALASAVDLDVKATKQRGHATHIVAGAVHEGVDAVFALGGDGTANEVLQALAGTDVRLGIIPGGGANVLARALGLPNDAVAATSVLLEHLRSDRTRRITLGRAGDRYFGFNAGFGFDAAVVRHVEQHARMKRVFRQAAFVASTTREWAVGEGREQPVITATLPDGSLAGPYLISMIANTDPYTYLGQRPMHVHPSARFDLGLDLIGLRRLSTPALLKIIGQVFRDGSHIHAKGVDYHHDLGSFTLSSSEPQPLMVDGDYSGEHLAVTFTAVADALRVLA
ncbi:diacylglycerol kinase family protein [Egicoccus sp. AB-alg6-2]|uniref:diacylglycerol/lipid kinase family protein n=1 Tax=Egicoccus sp. AB-alg6-2 TaxID=3242692 RepID=UPI00359DE5E4